MTHRVHSRVRVTFGCRARRQCIACLRPPQSTNLKSLSNSIITRIMERSAEQDQYLDAAAQLKAQYEAANLQLDHHMREFAKYKYDTDDFGDGDEMRPKDPAIVASDVAAQIVSLPSPQLSTTCSFLASRCRHFCGNSNSNTWSKTPRISMSSPLSATLTTHPSSLRMTTRSSQPPTKRRKPS